MQRAVFSQKYSIPDVLVLMVIGTTIYGLVAIGSQWRSEFHPVTTIDLSALGVTLLYASFGVSRPRRVSAFARLPRLSSSDTRLPTRARPSGSSSRRWTSCRVSRFWAFCRASCWACRPLPAYEYRARARRPDHDLHRPGLEHDLQLLLVPQVRSR